MYAEVHGMVLLHEQWRRHHSSRMLFHVLLANVCLRSCSCKTLRFPSGTGTCPLFKTPRAVVLPMPWILLTASQPDITWSDNKWGITSLCWRTVWPMSIGFIFCERGTIMISAEIPRECLKWQSNTNTSVSLHRTWITISHKTGVLWEIEVAGSNGGVRFLTGSPYIAVSAHAQCK